MHQDKFSGKAQDYNQYRPKYPEELKTILIEQLQLSPDKIVADIGSGTGISSELFLDLGNLVFAIEPNLEMRMVAEQSLDLEENFVSVEASAEKTELNDNSIDLIFVGTAFHWFNPSETKKEFQRILKKNGHIVIAYNIRDLDDDFQKALEKIFQKYFSDINYLEKQNLDLKIKDFFEDQTFQFKNITHSQNFSFEDLMGRLRSTSFFPEKGTELYSEIMEEVYEVFNKFQTEERINFKYTTRVYWV